jgi:hypothetical protein
MKIWGFVSFLSTPAISRSLALHGRILGNYGLCKSAYPYGRYDDFFRKCLCSFVFVFTLSANDFTNLSIHMAFASMIMMSMIKSLETLSIFGKRLKVQNCFWNMFPVFRCICIHSFRKQLTQVSTVQCNLHLKGN